LASVFVTLLYFSQRGRLDEAAAVKRILVEEITEA
jgi:hypothetical protein